MTTPLEITLHFAMNSDWHIGTGAGRHGGIDRLVTRDDEDLPYIPASTWRGMWRDAAEMLARGLDENDIGNWQKLVRELFGSQPANVDKGDRTPPTESRIHPQDACLIPTLRSRLAGKDAGRHYLREALTFVKPGVAIDLDTGVARTDYLRFEEMAISSALLQAKATVDFPTDHDDDRKALLAFLAGSAALIDRIGGKRRRGNGKCTVRLEWNNTVWTPKEAADKLRKYSSPPKPNKQTVSRSAIGSYFPGGKWFDIPIAVQLKSPLVMADEVLGNVITTLDYIPGSTLLPIIAAVADKHHIANVGDRLARGDLRVLPATTAIAGERGLPVPLCWSTEKDIPKSETIAVVSALFDKPERGKQYKGLRKGYITCSQPRDQVGVASIRTSLPTSVRTHNVIEDAAQTPTEDVGGVFSYEALVPGLIFRSIVRIRGTETDRDALRAALEAAFKSPVRLGRGKQAGYGVATLHVCSDASGGGIRRGWCNANQSHLVVWLESDALITGEDLAGTNAIEALGMAVQAAIGQGDIFDLANSNAWLRTRRIQSWQSKWHLPRPSLLAIQAGTVLMLKLKCGVVLDEVALKNAEAEGIGERRAEGFGAIRLNDATVTQKAILSKALEPSHESPEASSATSSVVPTSFTDAERTLLDAVVERAWKRRILARAEAIMSDAAVRKEVTGWDAAKGWPSMSQIGGLRATLP
ncbi:MAG: RAMP superfamily CRISPR-associated protein, partial [Hyphomicrobium sp.]